MIFWAFSQMFRKSLEHSRTSGKIPEHSGKFRKHPGTILGKFREFLGPPQGNLLIDKLWHDLDYSDGLDDFDA